MDGGAPRRPLLAVLRVWRGLGDAGPLTASVTASRRSSSYGALHARSRRSSSTPLVGPSKGHAWAPGALVLVVASAAAATASRGKVVQACRYAPRCAGTPGTAAPGGRAGVLASRGEHAHAEPTARTHGEGLGAATASSSRAYSKLSSPPAARGAAARAALATATIP